MTDGDGPGAATEGRPLVKICGLTRPDDVKAAADAGCDLVGFILVDWTPRGVNAGTAATLRAAVPAGVGTVGVFVDHDPDEMAAVVDALGLDYVQLHGAEPPEVVDRFGARAIKAQRLPAAEDAGPVTLPDLGPTGSKVLLDLAFHSTPSPAQLRAHWDAARRAGRAGHPVMLAGSLDPANLIEAIAVARPWAVDSARSTESAPGVKDHDLLRRFVAAARSR